MPNTLAPSTTDVVAAVLLPPSDTQRKSALRILAAQDGCSLDTLVDWLDALEDAEPTADDVLWKIEEAVGQLDETLGARFRSAYRSQQFEFLKRQLALLADSDKTSLNRLAAVVSCLGWLPTIRGGNADGLAQLAKDLFNQGLVEVLRKRLPSIVAGIQILLAKQDIVG